MQHGDISNDFGHTAAWDYRLFIDTDTPKLLRWLLRRCPRLAPYAFRWNPITLNNLEHAAKLYDQNTVVVTSYELATLFEDIAPTVLVCERYHLGRVECVVFFTADPVWAAAHRAGRLVTKVKAKIKKPSPKWARALALFEELLH